MCAEMSSRSRSRSSSACWALPIAPHCPQHWLFVLESKRRVYPFPALHDLAECGKNDISPPVSVTLKLMNVSAALKAVCMCLINTNNVPALEEIRWLSCWEESHKVGSLVGRWKHGCYRDTNLQILHWTCRFHSFLFCFSVLEKLWAFWFHALSAPHLSQKKKKKDDSERWRNLEAQKPFHSISGWLNLSYFTYRS